MKCLFTQMALILFFFYYFVYMLVLSEQVGNRILTGTNGKLGFKLLTFQLSIKYPNQDCPPNS